MHLKYGNLVKMNEDALQCFSHKKWRNRIGTFIKYTNYDTCAFILWEGNKTASSYGLGWLEVYSPKPIGAIWNFTKSMAE